MYFYLQKQAIMCGGPKRELKEIQPRDLNELQTIIRMSIQEIDWNIEMEEIKTQIANELIDFINIILLKHTSTAIIEK